MPFSISIFLGDRRATHKRIEHAGEWVTVVENKTHMHMFLVLGPSC